MEYILNKSLQGKKKCDAESLFFFTVGKENLTCTDRLSRSVKAFLDFLTPVLFLLVSSREIVKEAARLGELSTSLRARRLSPRNLNHKDIFHEQDTPLLTGLFPPQK